MQPLRNIKNRIRIIDNTRKVTDVMEKISITKLNRTDKVLFAMRPYFSKLDSLLHNFIANAEVTSSPFLEKRARIKTICLCVITSDSGLCGLYNNNVIRLADEFIKKQGEDKIKLVLIGKKGFNRFKNYGIEILKTYIGLHGKYREKVSDEISDNLSGIFLSQKVDEVYVAYTHHETSLRLKPVLRKFLNIDRVYKDKRDIEYILEPNAKRILEELIPRYILVSFRLILLESLTSEHAARTVAMKMATDNAEDLLKRLVLVRNKLRQANITEEMLEIIASSEALKG